MAVNQIGFGLVIGAGFIYVFEQSQTLLVPIFLHAVYNYSMGFGMWFYLFVILYYLIRAKRGKKTIDVVS